MLKIENLSVNVKGKNILKNINLHIRPGEVHVLFGPNGVGKSTIIGTIMGFKRYEVLEGKIYFKGIDITEAPVHERAKMGIGVMLQRPPTISGLKLRNMIKICGASDEEVETMAKWLELENFLDRPVNDGFSGGEIKRSELLQLMAQKPDLLLLDEPESGVDIENIALVGRTANFIINGNTNARDCKKCGHGFCKCDNPLEKSQRSGLIITHLGHILKYIPADIAHIVYNGTIMCEGEPHEMLSCISRKGYNFCVSNACSRREY